MAKYPEHILLFTAEFPPVVGGIARYTYELARAISEMGVAVTVIAPQHEEQTDFDKNLPFEILRWDMKYKGVPYLFEFLRSFRLARIIEEKQVDALLCGIWMPCGLTASWMRPRRPFAQIYYAAELVQPTNGPGAKVLNYFKHKTIAAASHHFPISSYSRQLLINQGVAEKDITLLPPGFSTLRTPTNATGSDLRKRKGWQCRKILLTVSRLEKHKGHSRVISILPTLAESLPDVLYVVVGSGPEEENLKNQVERMNLDNRVYFAGRVSDDELPEYFKAADVFIMLSEEIRTQSKAYVEGFGIVFLEAYSYQLPVIGSKTGGIVDVIEDGSTGFLVEPEDEEELLSRKFTRNVLPLLSKHRDDWRSPMPAGADLLPGKFTRNVLPLLSKHRDNWRSPTPANADLLRKTKRLLSDKELRDEMGRKGFEKLQEFNWENTAKRCLESLSVIRFPIV